MLLPVMCLIVSACRDCSEWRQAEALQLDSFADCRLPFTASVRAIRKLLLSRGTCLWATRQCHHPLSKQIQGIRREALGMSGSDTKQWLFLEIILFPKGYFLLPDALVL